MDPVSRRLRFPRDREVVITDTVGFIRDLPPTLMKAFRATLEGERLAGLEIQRAARKLVAGTHGRGAWEIELPPPTRLESPETLDAISRLSARLSEIDGLGRASSFLDLIERLNRLLHDDDPRFERRGGSARASSGAG